MIVALHEMTAHEIEERCMQLLHDLELAGTDWAMHQAEALKSEQLRKIVIANNLPAEGAMQGREYAAMQSQDYRTHILNLVELKRAENIAWMRYENLRMQYELLRSVLATRRAELQRLSS